MCGQLHMMFYFSFYDLQVFVCYKLLSCNKHGCKSYVLLLQVLTCRALVKALARYALWKTDSISTWQKSNFKSWLITWWSQVWTPWLLSCTMDSSISPMEFYRTYWVQTFHGLSVVIDCEFSQASQCFLYLTTNAVLNFMNLLHRCWTVFRYLIHSMQNVHVYTTNMKLSLVLIVN